MLNFLHCDRYTETLSTQLLLVVENDNGLSVSNALFYDFVENSIIIYLTVTNTLQKKRKKKKLQCGSKVRPVALFYAVKDPFGG